MPERPYRVACLAAALSVIVGLAGCGSDAPATPTTTTTTLPPCTQTTVRQTSGPISGRTLVFQDFSVPDTGRLDITMDWTNASSMVGFYIVPANTCTTVDEFNARTCNFLIASETPTKPRRISRPDFAAGNYRWIIGNYNTEPESVALQIVLSRGGCPALGRPEAASASTGRDRPALQQARPY
jgi:hypothetical protein